jgi:aminoglycoside phosphotransferase (APT) family kinase protein
MDFHPKNVIVTGRGPVVFDWGSFAVADPRADLAWTALLVRTYFSEEAADHIISAYGDRRPEGIEDLAFFEVSSIWRRFATIVGMLREAPPGIRRSSAEDLASDLPLSVAE